MSRGRATGSGKNFWDGRIMQSIPWRVPSYHVQPENRQTNIPKVTDYLIDGTRDRHYVTGTIEQKWPFAPRRLTTKGRHIFKGLLKCIDSKFVVGEVYERLTVEQVMANREAVVIKAKTVPMTAVAFQKQMDDLKTTITTLCGGETTIPPDVKCLFCILNDLDCWREMRRFILNHPCLLSPGQIEAMVCSLTNSYRWGNRHFLEELLFGCNFTVPEHWMVDFCETIEQVPTLGAVGNRLLMPRFDRHDEASELNILDLMRDAFTHYMEHDKQTDFFELENFLYSHFSVYLCKVTEIMFSSHGYDDYFP